MKQFKFIMFTAMALCSTIAAWADGTLINGIYYVLDADHHQATVTYTGATEATPSTYSGNIIIPDSVQYESAWYAITTIGKSAFLSCTSLYSVTLPALLTSIENQAFFHCTALDTLRCAATLPPMLGDNVFNNCPNSMHIILPCNTTSTYAVASGWSAWVDNMSEFCLPTIHLTVSSADTLGLVYPTDTTVMVGDSIQVIALPKEHCHFTGWSNGEKSDTLWIVATQDSALVAYFDNNHYTFIASCDTTMGQVTPTSVQSLYGDTIKVIATALPHYHFTGWSNHEIFDTLSVFMTQDTSLTASFALNQYQVLGIPNDAAKGLVTGSGLCPYGDSLLLRAEVLDKVKYIFQGWSTGSTLDSLWIKPQLDTMVTALFAMRPYEVTLLTNDSTWGLVSGSGIYDYGTSVQVIATPNEHYDFQTWSNASKDSLMHFYLTGDTTFIATFTPKHYKVFGASMDAHKGYVTPAYSEVTYGQSVTLYAHPTDTARFWFEKWSTSDPLPSIVVTPSSDTTLTTYWRNIYTVAFSTAISDPVPNQKIVDGFLSTEPQTPQQEPYKFMGWYTTEACETLFDFTGAITSDTTLYASWVIYTEKWDTAVCSYEWVDTKQGDTLIFDSGDYSRRYATPTLDSIHTYHLIVYTPSTDNDLANLAPVIIPMYKRWNIVLDVTSFTSIIEGLGGQMVEPDLVHWYKVIGEADPLDNSGVPIGDDVQAEPFTGYYHTEKTAMSGSYYAVIRIEHFEGQTCSATFRTNIVTMDPTNAMQRIGDGNIGYDILGRRVGLDYRGYIIYDDGTKNIQF